MLQLRSHLPTLFLLLTIPSLVAAQETAHSAPDGVKTADKQALELLETVSESIPSLRSSDNRVYLASAVADLLWTQDEKRARVLFEMVTKEMAAALAVIDATDQQSYNAVAMIQQQRREIIDRMVRRDPELALSFLRGTRLPPALDSPTNYHYVNEANLELHLAGLLAEKDPEQALQMGRATLRKGVSQVITSLLFQIAARNQGAAQTLHKEIVDQLKNENLAINHEAAGVACNLLTSFPPPQANDDTYRELIEMLTRVLFTFSPGDPTRTSVAQNFYNQLNSAMPQIEKYAPGRVSALRQWSQSVKRTLDPRARMYQELNELSQRGGVDDMLALADKYPPEFQTQIYQQAAWKALANGDGDRARQIVLELVSDPMQRRQMLEQLDNQLLWKSINENKIAEARQMLGKLRSLEQRAQILINLAANVANHGDKKQALDLLAEARMLIDGSLSNLGKLTTQVQVAQAYAGLDPQQSVGLMQSIIVQVNQLIAAAVVLDGFENNYLKDGEWTKRNYSGIGNLVNNIQQQLGVLARQDIEGARSLSNQLERPEIRLMAQLEIVQALLGGANTTLPRHLSRRSVRLAH